MNNINIFYNIFCYNKIENYEDIIKLFDVSIELNSDYLFFVKDLNIDFIINNINIGNYDKYNIIKV